MPARSPSWSPIAPTSHDTTAPPTIPVHRIPENDPWCSATEFSASENTIDHITDRKKPTAMKAMRETEVGPASATARLTIAPP